MGRSFDEGAEDLDKGESLRERRRRRMRKYSSKIINDEESEDLDEDDSLRERGDIRKKSRNLSRGDLKRNRKQNKYSSRSSGDFESGNFESGDFESGDFESGDLDEPLLSERDEDEYESESESEYSNSIGGFVQTSEYRDIYSAIFWIVHLIILIFLIYRYSTNFIQTTIANPKSDVREYIEAFTIVGIFSIFVSVFVLRFMIELGELLVKSIFVVSAAVGVIFLFGESATEKIFGALIILACFSYAGIAWKKIPIASANLSTALKCLRSNFGLVYLGFFYTTMMFLYSVLWLFALIGVAGEFQICPTSAADGGGGGNAAGGGQAPLNLCFTQFWIYIPFFFVYIWTFRVIVNLVIVISTQVTGMWWRDPEMATGCINEAQKKAFKDAQTYKFGSICRGATFSPYLDFLNELLNVFDTNEMNCEMKCTDQLRKFVKKHNQWGYVYVGLYGYDFPTSSSRAVDMFREMEWKPVIRDTVLRTILLFLILAVAAASAEFGSYVDGELHLLQVAGRSEHLIMLGLSFATGLILGNIMIAVISGPILAILVLFAEEEDYLEENDIDLYNLMVNAYRKAYPEVMG